MLSLLQGAQWLSGRVFDLRSKGWALEPHVSLSKFTPQNN